MSHVRDLRNLFNDRLKRSGMVLVLHDSNCGEDIDGNQSPLPLRKPGSSRVLSAIPAPDGMQGVDIQTAGFEQAEPSGAERIPRY